MTTMSDALMDWQTKHVEDRNPELKPYMGLNSNEGLETLIDKTGINGDPERAKKFAKLVENTGWVGVATEFVILMQNSKTSQKPNEPYILGLTAFMEATPVFASYLRGKEWPEAYQELKLPPASVNETDKFMVKIASSGKPIVFFVPPNLYTYKPNPKDGLFVGITKQEMEWLMSHPERCKNVYLVFGAYDMLNVNLGRKRDLDRLQLSEIFGNLTRTMLGNS